MWALIGSLLGCGKAVVESRYSVWADDGSGIATLHTSTHYGLGPYGRACPCEVLRKWVSLRSFHGVDLEFDVDPAFSSQDDLYWMATGRYVVVDDSVYDDRTGRLLYTFDEEEGELLPAPGGETVALLGDDGVTFVDARDGEPLVSVDYAYDQFPTGYRTWVSDELLAVSLNPNSEWLGIGIDGTVTEIPGPKCHGPPTTSSPWGAGGKGLNGEADEPPFGCGVTF